VRQRDRRAVVSTVARPLLERLTILWALVNVLAAASSLVLLLTVPVSVFVVTAAVPAWIVTCTGVVTTVADSVTTARREGLMTALSPTGWPCAASSHPGRRERSVRRFGDNGGPRLRTPPIAAIVLVLQGGTVGAISITCPTTGKPVSTGMTMEPESFRRSVLTGNSVKCPHCGVTHIWSKGEAIVD
jgi:hypothetical protein